MVDWYRDRQTQINNITYVVLAPWLTGIEIETDIDKTIIITYLVLALSLTGIGGQT